MSAYAQQLYNKRHPQLYYCTCNDDFTCEILTRTISTISRRGFFGCLTIFFSHVFILGKILIIGGGIANFTNVSATFKVNKHCCVGFFLSVIGTFCTDFPHS